MPREPLFVPFRGLGLVSLPTEGSACSVAVQQRGTQTFITTSVDRQFQVFTADKLRLAFVGPQMKAKIGALAVHGDITFTARGQDIIAFHRQEAVATFSGHVSDVYQLFVFGDSLISIAEDQTMHVWSMSDATRLGTLELTNREASVTSMCHPHTYLNKLLLGDDSGVMTLLNVRTLRTIFTFPSFGSGILCIEQSPALDVVAVGLADGRILLHNLKTNATLLQFTQSEGPVTSLSFRTDNAPGGSTLASGCSNGDIAIWDLEKGILHSVIRSAHVKRVALVRFFPQRNTMLTVGEDNAVKIWVFDDAGGATASGAGSGANSSASPEARLLKHREGHTAPPTVARFYAAQTVVSAGLDRSLRLTYTFRDQMNKEMSQGKGKGTGGAAQKRRKLDASGAASTAEAHMRPESSKLPPVTGIATSNVRERDSDWCNILTSHAGLTAAHAWRSESGALGKKKAKGGGESNTGAPGGKKVTMALKGTGPAAGAVTCVTISACGNYGFLGSASGWVDKYNIQSGTHRGGFQAHAVGTAVTALACDIINSACVSTGLDGTLRWSDFDSFKKIEAVGGEGDQASSPDDLFNVRVGSPVSGATLHRDSALLAVLCDDLAVRVYDFDTQNLVRVFRGHTARCTDLAFSPDSRWLVTTSLDCSLRVWHVPSGRMLEWAVFSESPATSVAFAPDGAFVATTHVDSLGIYLWANRAHFQTVPPAGVPRRGVEMYLASGSALPGDEVGGEDADKPSSLLSLRDAAQAGIDADDDDDDDDDEDEDGEEEEEKAPPVGAAHVDMAQTSYTHPRTWASTLLNLDAIKDRNKPSEAPKAPKLAPFILPTLPGTEPAFVAAPEEEKEEEDEGDLDPAKAKAKLTTSQQKLVGWDEDGDEDDDEDDDEEEGSWGAPMDDGEGGGSGAGEARIKSRIGNLSKMGRMPRSRLETALESGYMMKEYSEVLALLGKLSPSAADLSLRSLSDTDHDGRPLSSLGYALVFFAHVLDLPQLTDFDMVQACLSITLRIHGEVISESPDHKEVMEAIAVGQKKCWQRVNGLIQHNLCLVSFLGSMD